jgi:hypothetical protein
MKRYRLVIFFILALAALAIVPISFLLSAGRAAEAVAASPAPVQAEEANDKGVKIQAAAGDNPAIDMRATCASPGKPPGTAGAGVSAKTNSCG